MTNNKDIKKDLLLSLSAVLIKSEFKLKGSSFIRETESGLYQIINISLGPTTSSMANHIGIGFGIATEEWINNIILWKRPKNLTSADCEIRDIFCKLIKLDDDTIWHPISSGLTTLTTRIENYIKNTIILFLDKLKTRYNIINMWQQHKSNIGLAPGRHLLAIGTLMFLNENKIEGRKILTDLLETEKENTYFNSTITKILHK